MTPDERADKIMAYLATEPRDAAGLRARIVDEITAAVAESERKRGVWSRGGR